MMSMFLSTMGCSAARYRLRSATYAASSSGEMVFMLGSAGPKEQLTTCAPMR